MDFSGNLDDVDCPAFGWLPDALEVGGVGPSRWPLPGNELPPKLDGDRKCPCVLEDAKCSVLDLVSTVGVLAAGGECGSSIRSSARAFSGSSCSDRK